MPAHKGHRKIGGRTKGTPNKSTIELFDICKKHGCNVFEGMVIIAVTTKDPDKKFYYLSKLADYLYAKKKAIELSGEISTPQPRIVEIDVSERIKKLKGN